MGYPNSGSTLTSKISTGLSTQIVVKVNAETVGAIQSLTIQQTRPLQRIGEVGLDGTLEIVPRGITTYSATINRIVFDRLRLPEALLRGFVNIGSQLLPFDIQIIDRTNGDGDGSVVHTLKNCWFGSYNPEYKLEFVMSEQATVEFETIYTTQGASSNPVANGGARGISPQINARERQTDRGAFRGTMDVSGLINAAFE